VPYPAIDLSGAVVLITGGGRGIGRATGAAFAARGATVCLADLDLPAAQEAAADIGGHPFGVDVTSRASFGQCVAELVDRFGRVDVLVNNAGVMPLGGFLDEPDELSATTLDVNLWGLIHGMRLVLPAMVERGSGHVVNVASMAGKLAIPGLAVYNASKFGALGLSLAVRAELARTGVSVSAVLPSAVRTGLVAGVPLGRGMPTVEPEDVARAIVRSVRTRAAEIPVPGYLRLYDLVEAVLPPPAFRLVRRLLDDARGLTSVDHAARQAYEQRVADQAAIRQIRKAEADRP
jgi:NAD(P)-dependent dehydrogenase (short-subunit alcohol dehydrogenase family)